MEKVASAEQTFQHGFSAGGVYLRGLYETRAHEERGEEEGGRSESTEGGDRRNVNSNCQILKLPAS